MMRCCWTRFALFFLLSVLFFWVFPRTDLWLQHLFYDPAVKGFYGKRNPLAVFLSDSVGAAAALAVLLPLAGMLWDRSLVRPRVCLFLALSLALGPGLVVNEIFKNHWGRARPSQITEFGGSKHFTPPLLPARECARNCSFVSGDASVGFFLVSFALVLPRYRRLFYAASLGYGSLLGIARMTMGAHFFSDVIYSGFFVWLTAFALHAALFKHDRGYSPNPGAP